MKTMYTPPKKVLERYADVLVNYALGGGKGIKNGDVVQLVGSEASKPLYVEVVRAIRKSGGHIISQYTPDNEDWINFDREFYKDSSDEQIKFFPAKFVK